MPPACDLPPHPLCPQGWTAAAQARPCSGHHHHHRRQHQQQTSAWVATSSGRRAARHTRHVSCQEHRQAALSRVGSAFRHTHTKPEAALNIHTPWAWLAGAPPGLALNLSTQPLLLLQLLLPWMTPRRVMTPGAVVPCWMRHCPCQSRPQTSPSPRPLAMSCSSCGDQHSTPVKLAVTRRRVNTPYTYSFKQLQRALMCHYCPGLLFCQASAAHAPSTRRCLLAR